MRTKLMRSLVRKKTSLTSTWWFKTLVAVVVLALLGVMLFQIRQIVTSVLLSFAIAYMLNPLVDRLEQFGAKRNRAIILLLLLLALVLLLFFIFIVPLIISQLFDFMRVLPEKIHQLYAWLDIFLSQKLNIALPNSAAELIEQLRSYVATHNTPMLRPLGGLVQNTVTNTIGVLLFLLDLLLVPMLTVYFLMDFKKIRSGILELVPQRWQDRIHGYIEEIDRILASFFRGQFLLVTVLASFYVVGFSWVNFPMALFVGLISGLGHFIPYLGPVTAALLGLIFILADFSGWWQVAQFFIVIMTVQGLESFVLTPRLVGKSVGLSPVVTILSLLIFGKLFGFLGLLMAIPLAATCKIVYKDLLATYKNSYFYSE